MSNDSSADEPLEQEGEEDEPKGTEPTGAEPKGAEPKEAKDDAPRVPRKRSLAAEREKSGPPPPAPEELKGSSLFETHLFGFFRFFALPRLFCRASCGWLHLEAWVRDVGCVAHGGPMEGSETCVCGPGEGLRWLVLGAVRADLEGWIRG